MDKKTYDEHMTAIGGGATLQRKVYDELLEFATKRKVRKPAPDCVATDPAPKIKAICGGEGCDRQAVAKSLCSKHYTAERRKDPEVTEKAREASRRSIAKRKAA